VVDFLLAIRRLFCHPLFDVCGVCGFSSDLSELRHDSCSLTSDFYGSKTPVALALWVNPRHPAIGFTQLWIFYGFTQLQAPFLWVKHG
jgi:hypothetical protein